MSPSRDDELNARLDQLRGWGLLACTRLWARVDPAAIRDTFTQIQPALVAVHETQVMAALNAIDDYMTLKAGDDGLLYDVTWRDDRPGRPFTTASGRLMQQYVALTPVVVLARIKRGQTVTRSMQTGLNYLTRVYGSEPHDLARTVMWERFTADQQRAA